MSAHIKDLSKVRITNIRVRRSYPLNTSIEAKAEDAKEFHGWTVFLNNRHNIAHVMHHDDPEGYYRLKCRGTGNEKSLKGYSDERLLVYFFIRLFTRLNGRLVL